MSVFLVQMPYAALERPSIALGLLKTGLRNLEIASTVMYANWLWAERLGLPAYQALSESPAASLLGEWSFAEAAFAHSGGEDYLHEVLQREVPEALRQVTREAALKARCMASDFLDEVAQLVLECGPRIVGCSSTFQQNCASLGLLARIKRKAPGVITLMGGANCDAPMGGRLVRSFPWLDLAVSGEADLLFPELCALLLQSGIPPAQDLPLGVVHRDSRGATNSRATLQRMDDAPIPDYEEYFVTQRKSKLRRSVFPGLMIETSRGCWWGQKHHCTFCGLNGGGMSYRSKSAERVLSEFRTLSEAHGLKQFEVVDNILDMKHIRTVLPSLYGLGYKIFYETKANLKRSQLEVLSQAGVCWIQPGIESLHDAVLELMDKGNSAVMNVELLKNCKELGIRVDWSILCGFPGEKDEYYREMASWLPALYHLEAPIGLFCIRYDRFSPYHTNPEGYGVKLKPYWTYSHCYPLEAAELNELAYFFEDDGPGPPGRYVAQEEARVRPGLATLRQRVLEWQKCGPEVGLRMEDQDGELRVFDTRPTAGNQQYSLLGLEASICRACRGLKSRSALLTAVEELEQRAVSDGEMNQALQKVMDLALVLELGERFVGLAQMGGIRPPQVHFPGGSVSL